jgi:2',3'-cyclic-nucleotide 2'-phosphodiesterase
MLAELPPEDRNRIYKMLSLKVEAIPDGPLKSTGSFVREASVCASGTTRVLGTHTHVPTADASLLPGGTAYTTDVGMTGCKDSIIGFDRDDFLGLFREEGRRGISVTVHGPVVFNGVVVDIDLDGRRAVRIEPVRREWTP